MLFLYDIVSICIIFSKVRKLTIKGMVSPSFPGILPWFLGLVQTDKPRKKPWEWSYVSLRPILFLRAQRFLSRWRLRTRKRFLVRRLLRLIKTLGTGSKNVWDPWRYTIYSHSPSRGEQLKVIHQGTPGHPRGEEKT